MAEEKQYDVIVNCTPLGMKGFPQEMSISPHVLREGQFVMDTIYNPPVTKLLAEAEAKGAVAGLRQGHADLPGPGLLRALDRQGPGVRGHGEGLPGGAALNRKGRGAWAPSPSSTPSPPGKGCAFGIDLKTWAEVELIDPERA